MTLRISMWLSAAALLAASSQLMAAGDAKVGHDLTYTCGGCHGIPEYKNAYPHYHVPKIAGQNETYLVNALKAYKSGERQHPTMRAQAGSFSDQDIADIAAFLASKTADAAADGKSGEKH
jgi:cytochrome c553